MKGKTMRNRFKSPILLIAVFLVAYPAAALAKDNERETKKGCIKATINAIRMEIEAYGQRLKLAARGVGPAGNAEKFKKRIAALKSELKEFKNIKPENYALSPEKGREGKLDIFDRLQEIGPIRPPEKKEISIFADRRCRDGSILDVEGMTRSGPFYHVAGVVNGDYSRIKPNRAYKLTIYLVYKRDYFGFIPDYYVYIERIQKTPSSGVRPASWRNSAKELCRVREPVTIFPGGLR